MLSFIDKDKQFTNQNDQKTLQQHANKGYSFDPIVLARNRNAVDCLAIGSNVLWRLKINRLMRLQSQKKLDFFTARRYV